MTNLLQFAPRLMAESSGSSKPEQVAGVATLRRITRELSEIQSNPSIHWTIQVIGDNILEYHFTIRGPPSTDFEGGLYHGRILLPINYPFAPPSIMLLNPSGRFEVGKKICLSMSSYHPELWQPAWGIRTIMEALRSFFPTPGDGAIGALDWPRDVRKKLAIESTSWICTVCNKPNHEILPYSAERPEVTFSDEAPKVLNMPGILVPEIAVEAPVTNAPPVEQIQSPQVVHANGESDKAILLNVAIISVFCAIVAIFVDIIFHPY